MTDVPQGLVFFLFCVAVIILIIAVGIAAHANGQLYQMRIAKAEKEDEVDAG